MNQLETWQGVFGEQYTNRNLVDWKKRVPAFREMLAGLTPSRVLEVGCNRGHNLATISSVLGTATEIIGIEPNVHACELANNTGFAVRAVNASAYEIPFGDGYFDLAFTAGVLIHVPQESLRRAMVEIARVTSQYILCIEYFAETDTEISYRGQENLLWKRDFLKLYLDYVPNLELMRSGYWDQDAGFDRCHWWLMKKAPEGVS